MGKSCRNEDRDYDDLKTSANLTCWCSATRGLHVVGHGVLLPAALPFLFEAPLCHSHASLLLISLQLMRSTSTSPSFLKQNYQLDLYRRARLKFVLFTKLFIPMWTSLMLPYVLILVHIQLDP